MEGVSSVGEGGYQLDRTHGGFLGVGNVLVLLHGDYYTEVHFRSTCYNVRFMLISLCK